MIPVRLELRNFMSYGDDVTPLDFNGMHIACLSGDNGNGKSALLDAITWALWGEARASSDELIRLGADEMSVIFDFQLGDDLYRVIRSRSKRTSGNSWEIYIAEGGMGKWGNGEMGESGIAPSPPRPLAPSQSAWRPLTGQGVRDTGRIIQRILRMDYHTFINSAYIQQGRADEFTKQTVSDRKKILADILDLSRYDTLEQKAKQRRNDAEQQVYELEQAISRIEAELANEDSYRRNLAKSSDERQALESRIAEVEGELRQLQERKAELDVQADRIKELEKQITGWRTEVESLRTQQSDQEARVARAREIVQDKERILAGLAKLLASIREQVGALDALDSLRTKLQAQTTDANTTYIDLKGRHERMLQVKEDLESKVQMLGESAECPVCKTQLGREKHDAIVRDYRLQIERANAEIRDLKRTGSEAKSKRDSAQQEIARIDQQLKDGLHIRARLAQAEQLRTQAEKSWPKTADLSAVALAKAEPIALEELQKLLTSLQRAEESLPADEKSLLAISGLILAREKAIREATEALGELDKTIRELPIVVAGLSSAKESLQSLRQSDREVTGRIATLEQSLKQCKTLTAELKTKRKDLEQGKKDQAAYAELVAAFGKKGVQALIIENAIPEIQEEANRLLARMTDNAMQVSIETVRDKKTGGVAETLDIRISDDMGTRAYELFSGGEAFRINFALRIALSKLLARRAGARLQTLIIDEGFGTQDGKGREKLVEAIDSIRDDFERILVITHIEELKDAFPTRIEITKDSHGSQICVN